MKKSKLTHLNPQESEQKRIEEVRKLSYTQRLERLFVLIEISYWSKTNTKPNLANK